jgi:hypothetical protein
MIQILYVYDVQSGKHKDPRRTQFNKTLFGFKYRWETREGPKTRLRKGFVHLYKVQRIGDSVIAINPQYEKTFDDLFQNYQDIIKVRKYAIEKELSIKSE